ncbi:MAG: ABC transporter substrate-binding protein [Streptococcaceae bacterium]|nr:ABC transporter substrate-binding protein [Streptococcaceae bacterium]
MKKRNVLGMCFLLFTVLFVLSACGEKNEGTKKEGAKQETLRIGVMPSTDNLPILVAQKEGIAKKNGLSIEFVPFKSVKDRDSAFRAGKVDGVISDVIALAIYEQAGMNVKVTSTTDDRFDLVATKDVKDVSELKGKTVVVVKNGGIGYTAEKMLAANGMTPEDVQMMDIPPVPTRLELLKNGKAAAAVLPEPFITMAKSFGIHKIESTIDLKMNPFIIAFKDAFIKSHNQALSAFYQSYNAAVEEINANLKDEKVIQSYREILVKNVGFPEALTNEIEITPFSKATQIAPKEITEAFEWAKEKGLLKKQVKAEAVMDDTFIK